MRWWVIQYRTAGTWETQVIDGAVRAFGIPEGRRFIVRVPTW